MSLRVQAEADLAFTIEDGVGGFGWAVQLTSPDGVVSNHTALTVNTHEMGDPDTGIGVAARRTSVALRISNLPAGERPQGKFKTSEKPWQVSWTNLQGAPHTYRVTDTEPDDTLGVLVCHLEPYNPVS